MTDQAISSKEINLSSPSLQSYYYLVWEFVNFAVLLDHEFYKAINKRKPNSRFCESFFIFYLCLTAKNFSSNDLKCTFQRLSHHLLNWDFGFFIQSFYYNLNFC